MPNLLPKEPCESLQLLTLLIQGVLLLVWSNSRPQPGTVFVPSGRWLLSGAMPAPHDETRAGSALLWTNAHWANLTAMWMRSLMGIDQNYYHLKG